MACRVRGAGCRVWAVGCRVSGVRRRVRVRTMGAASWLLLSVVSGRCGDCRGWGFWGRGEKGRAGSGRRSEGQGRRRFDVGISLFPSRIRVPWESGSGVERGKWSVGYRGRRKAPTQWGKTGSALHP